MPDEEVLKKALREAQDRICELQLELDGMRESEAGRRYTAVFESASIPISIFRSDGIVVSCNRLYSDFFGYDRDEVEGKLDWKKLLAPEDYERVTTMSRDRASGRPGVPTVYEATVVTRTGEKKRILGSVGVIPDSDEMVFSFVDITEHLETERILRESAELHRAVIEKSKDAIAILQDGVFRLANSTCSTLSGYEIEELLGMEFEKLVPPENRENLNQLLAETVEGGQVPDMYQLELLRKDGERRTIEVLSSLISYKGDDAILLVARDITERLLEQRLKLEQRQIEGAIFDQSPIGISVRDGCGNLILCNARWAEIWNKDPADLEELLAREKHTELVMDHRDTYLRDYTDEVVRIYREGGDLHIPGLYVASLDKWIGQRFFGIVTEEGKTDKVVVLTEDVTDEIKARSTEEALRKSDEKYQTLVENLPVTVFRSAMDGRLLSVNPAMISMFCATSEQQMLETRVEDLYFDSSDRAVFKENLTKKGKLENYEVQLRRYDGSPFWASISAYGVRDEDGNIEAIDGIIRDISMIRKLEEEILRTQRLESIGILAGGIAHDFNNILAAVLGNISLAKTYTSTTHPVYTKLNDAEKASIRASELTQQLLTFAKGGEPVKKVVHLDRILRESSDFATRGSSVKCHFEIPSTIWSVEADEGQIGQVVNNLVINAIHAMPDGGRIDIRAENREIPDANSMSLDGGRYVSISVTDQGKGIPSENLDKIFDPYFTTKSEGSGLGLATSFSIVNKHSGRISVTSEVGAGTTFEILLPASDQETGKVPQRSSRLPRGSGRILVMDDEDSVQTVIGEMLALYGYRAEKAMDGLEAVSIYRNALDSGRPFDAVIMDLTVPGGMGGVEAISRLTDLNPGIRAVVSSGYSNDPVMANFADYGFKACISKPFKLEELIRTLHAVLNEP
jgi:PAS domain S-box-containing protein